MAVVYAGEAAVAPAGTAEGAAAAAAAAGDV